MEEPTCGVYFVERLGLNARNSVHRLLKTVFASAMLVSFSCLSVNRSGDSGLPEWVLNPPLMEGEDYVFVASGTNLSLDLGLAEKAAAQDVKNQILHFLGVDMTTTNKASAKNFLTSYQSKVEQSVLSASETQIAGLRVDKRFPFEQAEKLTLYLKVLYKKTDLDKEKARFAAAFAQIEDITSKLEKTGDHFFSSGRYMDAVEQYIQAATQALNPEIENALSKIERNINKAVSILSKFSLNAVIKEQQTTVGRHFNKTFDVRVVYRLPEKELFLSDVPLRFNYKIKKNNRLIFTGMTIKTDGQGMASLRFPTPEIPIKDQIVVTLDVSAYLEKFALASKNVQNKVGIIEDLSARSKLLIPYKVESLAKDIPLAVFVLLLDEKGTPLDQTDIVSSMQDLLLKLDFSVFLITKIDLHLFKTLTQAEALKTLKRLSSPQAKRLVFGSFKIAQVAQEEKLFKAQVAGEVKVFDLSNEKLVFNKTLSKLSLSGDRSSAISLVLSQLGCELGDSLTIE